MSTLKPLKLGLRLTRTSRARAGQLVYSKEPTSITACFYEFLQSQGLALSSTEEAFIRSKLRAPTVPGKLGRPCIILDRLPGGHFTVCFLAQLRGTHISPIGRFFGVPLSSTESPSPPNALPSFTPLQLTNANEPRRKGRFNLFAIPVVRQRIQVPPGKPINLVSGDLQRAINVVQERVMACKEGHVNLRREQMEWVEGNYDWKFHNPQERGVDPSTHLRL
ncbi:hypothetical protein C8J57DRAFT_656089 [Mycena rebaudengoi]|nr:hypothetical protein C8J57DRAFT_656089 [Mycena rebaudengoi]